MYSLTYAERNHLLECKSYFQILSYIHNTQYITYTDAYVLQPLVKHCAHLGSHLRLPRRRGVLWHPPVSEHVVVTILLGLLAPHGILPQKSKCLHPSRRWITPPPLSVSPFSDYFSLCRCLCPRRPFLPLADVVSLSVSAAPLLFLSVAPSLNLTAFLCCSLFLSSSRSLLLFPTFCVRRLRPRVCFLPPPSANPGAPVSRKDSLSSNHSYHSSTREK